MLLILMRNFRKRNRLKLIEQLLYKVTFALSSQIYFLRKAMLKKMSKEEVVKFLLGKGMRQDLIDHAYNQAAVSLTCTESHFKG